MPRSLRVTMTRSTIGQTARTRGTVRALGLRRIRQSVILPDSEAIRGMVRTVRFMVEVEEIAGEGTER